MSSRPSLPQTLVAKLKALNERSPLAFVLLGTAVSMSIAMGTGFAHHYAKQEFQAPTEKAAVQPGYESLAQAIVNDNRISLKSLLSDSTAELSAQDKARMATLTEGLVMEPGQRTFFHPLVAEDRDFLRVIAARQEAQAFPSDERVRLAAVDAGTAYISTHGAESYGAQNQRLHRLMVFTGEAKASPSLKEIMPYVPASAEEAGANQELVKNLLLETRAGLPSRDLKALMTVQFHEVTEANPATSMLVNVANNLAQRHAAVDTAPRVQPKTPGL